MSNVTQKIDRIGRIAAVVSTIVLSALLFNLWALKATALEQEPESFNLQPRGFVLPDEEKSSWFSHFYEKITHTGSTVDAIPAAHFEKELLSSRFGKPVAFANIDKLYLITKTGKIVGSADSCKYYNLPIISNDAFLVDEDGSRLVDEGTKNALALLAEIEKNYALKPILSEIKVKGKNIIAYMNMGEVMPVIFGQGAWDQKISNFISYQKQLGASELSKEALYLDLRVENRIIVKKNV